AALVPQEGQRLPRGGPGMGGRAGKPRGGADPCVTCPATSRLVSRWLSIRPPTDISQAESRESGIRKSHPSSTDSIQQAAASDPFASRTGATAAIRCPKGYSTAASGRRREEMIVQPTVPADAGLARTNFGAMFSERNCSDTIAAE